MRHCFSIIFLFLVISHQYAYAQATPAQVLLSAFSSQCPAVVTRQVQGSLANVQALGAVIDQFKNENQCFGAAATSSVVNRYSRLYEEFEVYQQSRDSKLTLERKIALFTTLLNDPSLQTADINYLRNEILYAQSDLVGIQAEQRRFGDLSSRYARGGDMAVQSLTDFLGTWSSNNACFVNKRSLAASLLSNTFLATSAFAAPATSLALAAGGLAIQSISRFISDFKFNNLISALDDAQMPLALGCVSQTITDQYCQAYETQQLIDVYRNDGRDRNPRHFEGLDLLSRQLDQLSHWLQEVYAGSPITSQGDLINREKPILQAALLEKIKMYVQTYGKLRIDDYLGLVSISERSDAIAIGIQRLVVIMSSPTLTPVDHFFGGDSNSSSVENPIFTTRERSLLVYQLFDPNITAIPSCSNGDPCTSFVNYTRFTNRSLSIGDWEQALANSLRVINNTLEVVNRERARTISVDGFTILVRANQDFRGETNALQGLLKVEENAIRIRNYLTTSGCESRPHDCDENEEPLVTHRYFPQITNVKITQELTREVIDLIIEGFRPRTIDDQYLPEVCRLNTDIISFTGDSNIEEKSFLITSCVTKLLKLAERGNDVYFTKVRSMVAYEMEARFANGEFEGDIEDVIYATRGDLVQSLLTGLHPDSGLTLSEVYTGLDASMHLSRETLKTFFKFFEKQLDHHLVDEPLDGHQKDILCMRVLPYFFELEPKSKLGKGIYEQCQNVSLNFYPDGANVRWGSFVERVRRRGFLGSRRGTVGVPGGKDEADVYCALRRYQRQNFLYEQRRVLRDKSYIPKIDIEDLL